MSQVIRDSFGTRPSEYQPDRHLLIGAPSSGSGKTVVTLGLLRALRNREVSIYSAKAGPDYIDPMFHTIASGAPCETLDPWGMQLERLSKSLAGRASAHCLIEGMMGLFDGAADSSGSAATLAKFGSIPVLMVVDVSRLSNSVAALVRGFRDHDTDVKIAGVILNRVGSPRHDTMLRKALEAIDIPVLGSIRRNDKLVIPERHLGLVQAQENNEIESFVEEAARLIEEQCDVPAIMDLFECSGQTGLENSKTLSKLGTRIAVARDIAFSFCYAHLTRDWKARRADIVYFSPLENEPVPEDCNGVYLPGGYPELHAEEISKAENFLSSLLRARDRGAQIYGECGGYMVLGKGLTDANGKRYVMAGLLDLETSFEKPKLHLGYRRLKTQAFPLGSELTGHEFHYSTQLQARGEPLFQTEDALGDSMGGVGLRDGNVMGSYMHVIDRMA